MIKIYKISINIYYLAFIVVKFTRISGNSIKVKYQNRRDEKERVYN